MRVSKRHFFDHLGSCFLRFSQVHVRGSQKWEVDFYEKDVYQYVFAIYEKKPF